MQTIGQVGVLSRDARPGLLGLLVSAASLIVLALALLQWLTAGWHPLVGVGLMAGAAGAVGPFQRARRDAQTRRAQRILTAWGAERGLAYQGEVGHPRATPTLDRSALLGPALIGPVGGDEHGVVGHYTYWVKSGKHRYPVPMSVALARIPGHGDLRVTIRESGPGDGRLFDDWKPFATASAEVDERFHIEIGEGADPVLVTELLDPVVLLSMLEGGFHPVVEFSGDWLLVAIGGHAGITDGVEDLAWFDRLREWADVWAARVRAT